MLRVKIKVVLEGEYYIDESDHSSRKAAMKEEKLIIEGDPEILFSTEQAKIKDVTVEFSDPVKVKESAT